MMPRDSVSCEECVFWRSAVARHTLHFAVSNAMKEGRLILYKQEADAMPASREAPAAIFGTAP